MARLVDSSIFIALERRALPFNRLPVPDLDEEAAVSAVAASELLVGVYRARTQEQRARREATVEAVLATFLILPFDLSVARVHARLAAELDTHGERIGAHDLIIAATALANGYDLLTANVRDFRRVPGLVVREPEW